MSMFHTKWWSRRTCDLHRFAWLSSVIRHHQHHHQSSILGRLLLALSSESGRHDNAVIENRMSSSSSSSLRLNRNTNGSPHDIPSPQQLTVTSLFVDDTTSTTTSKPINPVPDFNRTAIAYQHQTTMELIRAALLFGVCRLVPPQHAESIVQYSYRFLGRTVTNHALRLTLYHQFCAGPDLGSATAMTTTNTRANIGRILDFAAAEPDDNNDQPDHHSPTQTTETRLDENLEHFLQSIRTAASLPSGCVAIKLTGLVDAALLSRVSFHRRRGGVMDDDYHADFANHSLSDPKDVAAWHRFRDRCRRLAETAQAGGVRLLFDAEQVRYQPAIDAVVLQLQRVYNSVANSEYPIIYNTYQCYLKDSTQRLQFDLELSQRFQYHMGIKLVRGAYMESERYLAQTLDRPSPIHDTIHETHQSYNTAIDMVLQALDLSHTRSIELMCATHNPSSIEHAIRTMNARRIDRARHCVSFAQLWGMKDNLTNNLAHHGYPTYKYVPYGDVAVVVPYLLRRAMENSAIRGGAEDEWRMILEEVVRRATHVPKIDA